MTAYDVEFIVASNDGTWILYDRTLFDHDIDHSEGTEQGMIKVFTDRIAQRSFFPDDDVVFIGVFSYHQYEESDNDA